MPNEIGLFTKQEAKEIRDLRLTPDYSTIILIANIIRGMQIEGEYSSFDCDVVVTDGVENYFKNTVGYSTNYIKQGYPSGTGLLVSISWA